ncbi:hypothetical protein GCM10009613_55180 [Pseudonocardia kongjuensis]|uniref:FtsK domain-containing protein n=1 Tax=Pseudonocardia kongjuensis TaxID=102227 RepID=A0ABP4IUM4_9PSEU
MRLFARPRRDRDGEALVEHLVTAWTRACEGADLVRNVDTVTGPTVIPPKLVDITLGPPTVLIAELQPGMIPADVTALAPRIAPHLDVHSLRVEPIGHRHVRVTLLDADPLDTLVQLDPGTDLMLGRDDAGHALRLDPIDLPHTITQGVTRSGKSVWTYALLAQLAGRDDVSLSGCDPTGLLWRPFRGTHHADRLSAGLTDLDAHEKVLRAVVDEMDDRIRDLPDDRDQIEIGPARLLIVVVLEEYPGLLRVLDAGKTRGDDPGQRVRALVSRLLAEGAKAGVRVVILAQRAEASVVGAFERAMCSLRISFRTDNRASVELLHPGTDPAIADAHTTAAPGVALITRPGHTLTRFRAPFLGGYPEYAAAVRRATS